MLKLDIFNPKMLYKCHHALGDNSNPIDGPSMNHRWAAMGPSMPIDGIDWSLSTVPLVLDQSVARKWKQNGFKRWFGRNVDIGVIRIMKNLLLFNLTGSIFVKVMKLYLAADTQKNLGKRALR